MHNTSTTQVLLVLLFPLCFVAYGYAFFGSKWKLFLRYRLSHSTGCFAHKSSCFVCTCPSADIFIWPLQGLLVLATGSLIVTAHV